MQVTDVRLRSESCKCSMSRSVCNYYLLEPINIGTRPFITSFYPQVCLTLPTIMCPLYAPCVKDGECRYCGMNAIAHRKFYLYSTFARKIQKCYLQYVFVKKVIPMYMKMFGNRLNRKWSYRSSNGLLVFLGISATDTSKTIDWLSKKIVGLRIFSDQDDKMNFSVKDF